MTEPQPPRNDERPPATPDPGKPGPGKPGRRLFEAGAVALGIGAGVAFADPVLAAADSAWHGYVLPAYQAMIENGLLAWCF